MCFKHFSFDNCQLIAIHLWFMVGKPLSFFFFSHCHLFLFLIWLNCFKLSPSVYNSYEFIMYWFTCLQSFEYFYSINSINDQKEDQSCLYLKQTKKNVSLSVRSKLNHNSTFKMFRVKESNSPWYFTSSASLLLIFLYFTELCKGIRRKCEPDLLIVVSLPCSSPQLAETEGKLESGEK